MEKYFIRNDYTGYLVQIFETRFSGASTEIFGKISFDKGSVDNILDTIRGTGLSLKLEANPLLTFDEFSEADEKTYTVKVTKNSVTVFNGFLKPDGVTQSFVRDIWVVDLDFIDGLGTLKDLSFVKSNGFTFTGKLSMFEVIEACLARTGIVMTINSFIDVYYIDYAGTNILKDTYINSERFVKVDDNTIMTCEEVLNSVLNIFSACITQQDGQWWVYRPNEFINNVTFIDNTLNTTFTKNLYKKVGSQIDNYFPHHSNGNQQIQTKGAISAYRLNYKYGFKTGMNSNPTLHHDSALIFDSWTKATNLYGTVLINDLNDTMGLKMETKYILSDPILKEILRSQSVFVNAGSQIDLKVELSVETNSQTNFGFNIVRSDGYWTDSNGVWKNTETLARVTQNGAGSFEWTLKIEPVPSDCTVYVIIKSAVSDKISPVVVEVQRCELINNFNYDGKIGEFHTVQRNSAPSSIIKENQEVYNGDSIGDVFIGAIYKSDKTTLTTVWTRKGKLEEKSILQISAEDDMRIQQKPIKEFTGDFYGYLPYLSVIEINNINGLFMFVEYSYDTDTNITKGKLLQFFTSEVADLNYSLTFDYGQTTKPSIRG